MGAIITLYHYTSREHHLALIMEAGYLKTVESNVSFRREHAGPPVVWLTTQPDLVPDSVVSRCEMYAGLPPMKLEVRITVRLPSAAVHRWERWATRNNSTPKDIDVLKASGGGGWRQWRVVQRPIPSAEWVDIIDTRTGEVLWTA